MRDTLLKWRGQLVPAQIKYFKTLEKEYPKGMVLHHHSFGIFKIRGWKYMDDGSIWALVRWLKNGRLKPPAVIKNTVTDFFILRECE